MKEKKRFCSCGCGKEVFRLPNSTIYPKLHLSCAKRERNKKLLGQSTFSKAKVPKKGLKSKSGNKKKFSLYRTIAWRYFSRYVLLFYADDQGVVQCCTSGRYLQVNQRNCHLGHYCKVLDGNSSNYATAFDFVNVSPQSSQDNTFMGGRQNLMREWLVKTHGEEAVKEMELRSKRPFHLDKYTLDKIAEEYKLKFNNLVKERGFNPWKK